MTKTEFIKILKNNRDTLVINKSLTKDYYINMWMKRIENLKKLTERIDFGCRFDKNGKCNAKGTNYKHEKQCCCVDCDLRVGYLDVIHEIDVSYYAERYNKKTGFWRKGKGCILDRHKRSKTCITYVCGINKELKNELRSMEGCIRDYEHLIRKGIAIKNKGE
jgi:hypothetical protein